MPYQVQQLLKGKGMPTCVRKDDAVSKALSLMIENDFSQLPVVTWDEAEDATVIPEGMITYEGILRGIRNFKANIQDLKVRDVMTTAHIYDVEDDLFDILDRLKNTNAVLVIEEMRGPDLVGIVTNYDTAEYFQARTEDLMRIEDIELMVKEFIRTAYTDEKKELNEEKLNSVIAKVVNLPPGKGGNMEASKSFDELSLSEYISLLLAKETWIFLEPVFGVQRAFVKELLNGVRETRNALAHFRREVSIEERDKLKFGAEWLSRCQDEYQARKEREERERLIERIRKEEAEAEAFPVFEPRIPYEFSTLGQESSTDFSVTESATGGGRYAALADWLQSQPGRIDQVPITFNQIEEIIGTELPASARNHRAWWANDSVGHTHSQLWLDAGWRTGYINLTEGKVTFSRIREREKAYIVFFSKLVDELHKRSDIPMKDASPDGASWIVVKTIPKKGPSSGSFTFSFSRDKRLRVELYLDLGDQSLTKHVFDKLFAQREAIESQVGGIEWERLDNRRASRLALYHDGEILDTKGHPELRKWAVDSMIKFYGALIEPVERTIAEVKNG